jgi:hypothetical protein
MYAWTITESKYTYLVYLRVNGMNVLFVPKSMGYAIKESNGREEIISTGEDYETGS